MHIKLNDQIRKILFRFMLGGIALFLGLGAGGSPVGHVQEAWAQYPGAYYSVTEATLPDGTVLKKIMINGPPVPPPGFEVERQAVSLPEPDSAAGIKTLTVPAFNWVFGCSAVSGAMIAGYYDRVGWPNMYTGPTNGGVMPLDNSSWPTWSDGYHTYPNCPLIASKNGVDGRAIRGSIDDYWIQYGNASPDPYITNGWTQHAWGDAIGDYMKTSQSYYDNTDGSTTFWSTGATVLTCSTMETAIVGGRYISETDGTYGRKQFYEARGYTVTDCYNQETYPPTPGGFSFAQFKAEIDAGRPVMLQLEGHTIVGVGYDDSTQTVYIHDTWDHSNHTMTWGDNYSGMYLWGVSIVNLQGTVESFIYVAGDGECNGKRPCSSTIQSAIDSAQSFTVIEITQETYDENVTLGAPKVLILDGGWNAEFTSNSFYTTIQGSLTIRNGTMTLEKIILK
jgi:hypothetical protein